MAQAPQEAEVMAQQGRNARCRCGSGRKVKRCCGVQRGPSEAELAKAWLYQWARAAALVLDAWSDAEVVALLDAATRLPTQDVSMQLELPRLLSPALERLRAAVAEEDPDGVAAAVPAALVEVDTPLVRAGLVRAVQALRDAGRVSDAVAAAVAVEQASRSTKHRAEPAHGTMGQQRPRGHDPGALRDSSEWFLCVSSGRCREGAA